MVLISQVSSSGKRRQCNARCHGAKRPICKCICCGLNHGQGLQNAMANTAELAKHFVNDSGKQLSLPNMKKLETFKTEFKVGSL